MAVIPLLLAYDGHYRTPSLTIGLADGYGLAGLGLLGAQAILGERSMPLVRTFGQKKLLDYHRILSGWTVSLLAAHPLLLINDNRYKYVPLFDGLSAPWRARFGVLSGIAVLCLMILSWRRLADWCGRRYWLVVHRGLFLCAMGGGITHAILVAHYVSDWEGAVMVGAFITLTLLGVRVVRTRIAKALA